MAIARTALLVALVCAAASPAAAQGNGRGHAYGHTTRGSGPSASTSPELQEQIQGLQPSSKGRIFGSWLDDATVMEPGVGGLTLSVGYWRTPAYREWDMPVADASLGLTRRVQVGVTAPYFHAGEPGGAIAHGLGDLYVSGKVQLRDPSAPHRRVGFSVTPVLEVLTAAPSVDQSRLSWALPGNVEVRGTGWRAFGSAGYFSRGSLFASGAVEAPVSDRAWVTGTISRSHSIERDDVSRSLGLVQTRTDVSGSLSVSVGSMMMFGSVGRTISKLDANSSTLTFTAGVAVAFDGRRRP
jgi:hypothetical protein